VPGAPMPPPHVQQPSPTWGANENSAPDTARIAANSRRSSYARPTNKPTTQLPGRGRARARAPRTTAQPQPLGDETKQQREPQYRQCRHCSCMSMAGDSARARRVRSDPAAASCSSLASAPAARGPAEHTAHGARKKSMGAGGAASCCVATRDATGNPCMLHAQCAC
jgi:hypothetical protein